MNKQVFAFEEGDGKNKVLLGGKGANLCEMTQIGLNVPPGFVITTETCLAYLDSKNDSLPESLMSEVQEQMTALEEKTGKKFGDDRLPTFWMLNLGLEKTFKVSDTVGVTLFVDGYSYDTFYVNNNTINGIVNYKSLKVNRLAIQIISLKLISFNYKWTSS